MNAATSHDLKAALGGEVIVPGDDGYESARGVWNASIDRRPAAIVRCHSVDDVTRAVQAAVRFELALAVRGGGHSAPGFSTCDGGLVVDVSPMKAVDVDPDGCVARVGGGTCWSDVDRATTAHGLATTGGLVSTTGVAGLTLGGGIGWLMRRCGLACDNLLAADVVTAAGHVERAGTGGDSELLWGLRGGGGNFGVVTSFEFKLHPLPEVVAGLALFPATRALEVATFYREWVVDMPDELTTMLVLLTGPDEAFVPPSLRGELVLAVAGCHSGGRGPAYEALRPLRDQGPAADLFEPMPYVVAQSMFDADYPAGDRYYFKGGLVDTCSDELVALALEHMRRRPNNRSEFDFHHVGGAVAEIADDATAVPGRSAAFNYNVIGAWSTPAEDETNRAWARAFATDLDDLAGAGVYLNFLSEVEAGLTERAYGQDRYARLAALKRRHDPDNVFSLNQNIRPGDDVNSGDRSRLGEETFRTGGV
jgi:FAD/FMN-containing dehydrogenase